MNWVAAVEALRRERRAGVLVTLVTVRGHAPREAGAKMVVAADATWDSIGGGNLEATAVARARAMLADEATGIPELMSLSLNDKAPGRPRRAVLRRRGHHPPRTARRRPVGRDLRPRPRGRWSWRASSPATTSSCTSSTRAPRRPRRPRWPGATRDALARVHVHHAPVPELVLGQVPTGTHVLVMTHDHAEDIALCDVALRCSHLGSVGLIGSSAKWSRFRVKLAEEGHGPDAARPDHHPHRAGRTSPARTRPPSR